MKIAVFSDTHKKTDIMREVVGADCPEMIIHLGDHDSDAAVLRQDYPFIPVYSVCGNCDYDSQEPEERVLSIGSIRIFVTHGHLFYVREGIDFLVYEAKKHNCQLALYGHTHLADYQEVDGVTVVNPGTAGVGWDLSWALISISDSKEFTVEINHMKNEATWQSAMKEID